MKQTRVYLTEAEADLLRNLSEREGRSQAAVLRAALPAYEAQTFVPRYFSLDGCVTGDGTSIADVPDEELMKGFGEDSFGSTSVPRGTCGEGDGRSLADYSRRSTDARLAEWRFGDLK